MKLIKLIAILLLLVQHVTARENKNAKNTKEVKNPYELIDKKALELPDSLTSTTDGIAKYISASFSTDDDKVRAIYVWIATNIAYDYDNMFAINFYEKPEEKIAKPLLTRKGICENYAALFTNICTKAGIKSYLVEGYTKQNGFADYIPHAWCASRIDSTWFMYDPTWGSGYVRDGRFYHKLNNENFKVPPTAYIKTHIPFDFLWEFLYYPVTNQEFYEGKTATNDSKPYYHYTDSIALYMGQERMIQLRSTADRITRNGVKNAMVFDRLHHIQAEIENLKAQAEYDKQNKTASQFNKASVDFNDAINNYNVFIEYRNKQFTPLKPDAQIRQMLDTVSASVTAARAGLSQIADPGVNATVIAQLDKAIKDITPKIDEQRTWLNAYFKKGKEGRKAAFMTVSWFK